MVPIFALGKFLGLVIPNFGTKTADLMGGNS